MSTRRLPADNQKHTCAQMKKHFPNILTCCNLLSGCLATYFAFHENYRAALALIVLGAVFDFFDGFAARLLHVSSPLGKELDSLADDITFGFAPAAIVFAMLGELITPGGAYAAKCPAIAGLPIVCLLPYLAFLIAAFSGLRLAKFNIDERQTTSFIGLPTPANALFWASVAVCMEEKEWLRDDIALGLCILAMALFTCWLLVCEIPMFALKFKHFKIRGNELRYSFAACGAALVLGLGVAGLPAAIVLYVLVSVMNNLIGTKVVRSE